MILFSEYVAWENFVAEDLVGAEVEEIKAEASLKIVEMQQIALYPGSGTVTAAKAFAKSSESYVVAYDRYLTARTYRKVLSVQQESLGRTSQFISRELTRRTSMSAVERRSDRYAP